MGDSGECSGWAGALYSRDSAGLQWGRAAMTGTCERNGAKAWRGGEAHGSWLAYGETGSGICGGDAEEAAAADE